MVCVLHILYGFDINTGGNFEVRTFKKPGLESPGCPTNNIYLEINMFLNNKYTKWYNSIIANASIRSVTPMTYVEKHHIIPRSMGGSDNEDNLVKLTAKEHFVCHLLLTKMTSGHDRYKMIHAVWWMCNTASAHGRSFKVSGSLYQRIREENKSAASIRRKEQNKILLEDPDYRKKLSQAQKQRFSHRLGTFFGKTHTDEAKEKIRNANKGKNAWNKNKTMPDEVKERIRDSITKRYEQLGLTKTKNHVASRKAKFAAKKELHKQNYTQWYQTYKQLGFEEFVRVTGYPFTYANFCQRCKKLGLFP